MDIGNSALFLVGGLKNFIESMMKITMISSCRIQRNIKARGKEGKADFKDLIIR